MNKTVLALSPTGHLYIPLNQLENTSVKQSAQAVCQAFRASEEQGLLFLANHQAGDDWSAILHFWQEFAATYVRQLSQLPADQKNHFVLSLPGERFFDACVAKLPPMLGAEYCSAETLSQLWQRLTSFVEQEVVALGDLHHFFVNYLSRWQQVGRVCFHLAENKKDPDHPFAFLATYASHLGKNAKVQHLPLNQALQEYAGAGNKAGLVKLLKPIDQAGKRCEWVQHLLESKAIYHPLRWQTQQAYQFLKSVPQLEDSGVVVKLPDWWKKRPRAKVAVSIGSSSSGALDLRKLLRFRVSIAVAGDDLTPDEMETLLASESGLVFLRGQWVEVDNEKLQAALAHWQSVQAGHPEGVSFIQAMRLLAGTDENLGLLDDEAEEGETWFGVEAGDALAQLLVKLRDPGAIQSQTPKQLMNAHLRPYQQKGLDWLSFLTELGLGACLADDMGLGKTIQIIALLLLRKQKQQDQACSLLVLPASLLSNWKSELEKFAPSLSAFFFHPSETSRQAMTELTKDSALLKQYDVVLTTYHTVWRQTWWQQVTWELLILDEAQAIKNPSTKQTKALKSLPAKSRIALTGTPIENRIGDLWSLFDFLSPGLLGSSTAFKRFIKSLNDRDAVNYEPLRKLVQPYILRRLKTDKRIISDLPDKIELDAYCGLTRLQATLYQKKVDELQADLRNAELSDMQRKGLIINALLRFKQICNHPSQAMGQGDYQPSHSGKFERLAVLCEEIHERQEKVLIFTQFKEMTQPIARFLETVFGQSGLILHGSTPVKARKQLVENFQSEKGAPFFVLSLKAGGTGLNLTAANHVIHFDRWWNPAVENQATDRAFRIGQKRNVLVHKLICHGTVEENIDLLIKNKIQLSNEILSEQGEPALTELSNEEVMQLVRLDLSKTQLQ